MYIYIGNLPWETTEADIAGIFEQYGGALSVCIPKDKVNEHPLGMAFVEVREEQQGQQAIEDLNRNRIGDRVVIVVKARDRIERRQYSRHAKCQMTECPAIECGL